MEGRSQDQFGWRQCRLLWSLCSQFLQQEGLLDWFSCPVWRLKIEHQRVCRMKAFLFLSFSTMSVKVYFCRCFHLSWSDFHQRNFNPLKIGCLDLDYQSHLQHHPSEWVLLWCFQFRVQCKSSEYSCTHLWKNCSRYQFYFHSGERFCQDNFQVSEADLRSVWPLSCCVS